MSSETEDQVRTTASQGAKAGESLGTLMAEGQTPPRHAEPTGNAASFAAQDQHAPEQAERAPTRTGLRTVVLRVLLVLNIAAMAAVLIFPFGPALKENTTESPKEPANERRPDEGTGQGGGPATTGARTGAPVFPEKDSYNHALRLANEGKWVEAATELEQDLRRNPGLPNSQRRMIYFAMQHYNTQAGRTAEAEACLASAQSLLERSFLPEDLLRGAELAEKGGNGAEMRRNYARFLLLQKSLPAALRERISEAYLKLGDSYRVEADRGERKAEEEQQAQRQKLRSKEGAGAREGRR